MLVFTKRKVLSKEMLVAIAGIVASGSAWHAMAADSETQGATTRVDSIDVRGFRGAQSRAIEQQRSSDRIVSIISADSLGDFPDVSVAESVARVSGVAVTRHRGDADQVVIRGGNPAWTRVAVDGMNIPFAGGDRAVSLGQINSDVISSVEVTKAPTPDMDADAIGGTVNIVTRGAFTSPSLINGKAAGGYSELGNNTNYDMAMSVGRILGESQNYGVMLSYAKNSMNREMNNHEPAFTRVGDEWLLNRSQTKAYDIRRERTSMELRFDYVSDAEDRHFYMALTRNHYMADEDRHGHTFLRNGSFSEDSTPMQGVWEGTRVHQIWRDRHDVSTQNLLRLGGSFEFENGMNWDYAAAYAVSDSVKKPGRKAWTYRWDTDDRMMYDLSNPDFPVLRWEQTGEVPHIGNNIDPDALRFRHGNNYLEDEVNDETSYQLQTNLTIPMEFGDLPGSFKFGTKVIDRRRSNDYQRYIISSGGPELSEILSPNIANNFGEFPFGYRFDKRRSDSFLDDMTLTQSISNSYSDDFNISESVYSGYGMSVVDINDLRLIAGARIEHTRTNSQGFRSLDNWATVPEMSNFDNSYTNVFPAFHARYNMGDNIVMRAAVTTGVERPSFSRLRPTVAVDDDAQLIDTSNLNLRAATSRAYDLMFEYYTQPIGVFSFGLFMKEIKGIHFNFSREGMPGEDFNGFLVPGFDLWEVRETVNSDRRAQIQGVEVNWDQALTFLPGWLDGFGIFTNYTYTNSKAYLPESGDQVPLGAQPDHTLNFAVYYEKAGFSTRLSYNYQSRRISGYGAGTPDTYNWWDDRGIVDLTARYIFNNNVTVYAELMNLSDSRARRYLGDRSRVYELEDFGRAALMGVRFNF